MTARLSASPYGRSTPTGWVFDSRGALGDGVRRAELVRALAAAVAPFEFDTVAGIANSGTTWGLLLAIELGLPFANVLVDGPRSGGLQRNIEPVLPPGTRVLLVDNWTSSGDSFVEASRLCRAAGALPVLAAVIAGPVGQQHVAGLPLAIGVPLDSLD
jgi:orotate phosphoribosyltransferase